MSKYLNLFFGDEIGNMLSGLNMNKIGINLKDIVDEDADDDENNSMTIDNTAKSINNINNNNNNNENNENVKQNKRNFALGNKKFSKYGKKTNFYQRKKDNLSLLVKSANNSDDKNDSFSSVDEDDESCKKSTINKKDIINIDNININNNNDCDSEVENEDNTSDKLIINNSCDINNDEYVNKNIIKNIKKQLINYFNYYKNLSEEENQKLIDEHFLGLDILSYEDKEKIYRLSDLFIPINNNKLKKKIEKYNSKIINNIDKEEIDIKKEEHEAQELKNLIFKSKNSQKYTKVNYSYNEKFFDKTFLLDRIKNEVNILENNNNNNNIVIEDISKKNVIDTCKLTSVVNTNNSIKESNLLDINVNDVIETNLINCLINTEKKIRELNNDASLINNLYEDVNYNVSKNNSNDINIVNMDTIDNSIKSSNDASNHDHNNNIKNNNNNNNNNASNQIKKNNFNDIEKSNLSDFDGDIKSSNEEDNLSFNNFIKSKNNLNIPISKHIKNNNKNQQSNDLNSYEQYIEDALQPILNDDLEQDMIDILGLNSEELKLENLKLKTINTNIQLYDNLKRKRYKYPPFVNNELNEGSFINCILTDDTSDPLYYLKKNNYSANCKKIFNVSDYNMNFELSNSNHNKFNINIISNRKRSDDAINQNNVSSGKEDLLFSNFIKATTLPSYSNNPSNSIKISKINKSNVITHAKCAYNLIYNKILLTYEDLKNFHRPDFSKYLFNINKNSQTMFKISNHNMKLKNINNNTNNKSFNNMNIWPVHIRSRNYLKNKEKKRIQKNVQYMNAYEVFKNHHKLSLNEGKYCLFEYLDENPLFMNNFGMASRIKKYLTNSKLFNINSSLNQEKKQQLTDNDINTINIIGPNGIQILLQEGQKIPLLGQLDNTNLKGLALLENKMFKSPLFYEKYSDIIFYSNASNIENNNKKNNIVTKKSKKANSTVLYSNDINNNTNDNNEKPAKRMQFLLTFKKKSNTLKKGILLDNDIVENNNNSVKENIDSSDKFYLRELDHTYLVGQQEPKIEIYAPQSKQYLNFLKKKVQFFTERVFEEVGFKSGINFKFFTSIFPNVTEQNLKKYFKEFGIDVDKNICFYNNNNINDNTTNQKSFQRNYNLITPENICQYESCLFGRFKLLEIGIKNLTNSDKISYASNKFIQNTTNNSQHQFLAKVVEEEVLTTPWNLTNNYLQSKNINGMLSIKGIGDPSNGNGGYSFIKMPIKQYNSDNKTLKQEIDQLKEMNVMNLKMVTGTDADLRKLSKNDIKMKLIQLGVEEDYINKLSRWNRVSLLRYKSSKAAELGYEGDITKYARGNRLGISAQKEAYQNNINEVFAKFIDYIERQKVKSTSRVLEECSKEMETKLKNVKELNLEDLIDYEIPIYDKTISLAKMDNSVINSTSLYNINAFNFNKEYISRNNNKNINNTFEMKDNKKNKNELEEDASYNTTTNYLNTKKLSKTNNDNINSNSSNKLLKCYTKSKTNTNNNINNTLRNDYYRYNNSSANKEDIDNMKITLNLKRNDLEFLKQKKKLSQGFNKVFEFDKSTPIICTKRRIAPERKFNELLEGIVDSCIRFDKSRVFVMPVKKKDVPDYYNIIKSPMDLTSIKNKTKRNEYLDTKSFIDDLKQIVINSEIYNGSLENSIFTKQANSIYDYALLQIESNKKELEEAKPDLN